jgi:hypothetical protein
MIHWSLLFALALCMQWSVGHAQAPDASTATPAARVLHLKNDVAQKYAGGFGREFAVGALAGAYRLESMTAEGRYFLAEKPTVWWKTGNGYLLLKKAGLWVPADPAQHVRIYFYNYAGHASATSLEEIRAIGEDPARLESQIAAQKEAALNERWRIPGGVALIDLVLQSAWTGAAFHSAPPSPDFSRQVRAALSP